MSITENSRNPAILHVVIGTTSGKFEKLRNTMNTTQYDTLFIHHEESGMADFEETIQHTDWAMVVFTVTENPRAMEYALRLSKMVKEHGILSMIAIESKTWNAAEFLAEHHLDMAQILAHTDSLILVPGAQHFYSNVTTSLSLAQRLLDEDGFINLDLSDLSAMLKDAGLAYLGCRTLKGHTCEERMADLDSAEIIPKEILATAKSCLIQMNGCMDIGLDDVEGIVERVQQYLPDDALIVFGAAFDDELQDEIQVNVLASGFEIVP